MGLRWQEEELKNKGGTMIYLIILIAIVFLIETSIISLRIGNGIKELEKLNKEFSKYSDWCYKNILTAMQEKKEVA